MNVFKKKKKKKKRKSREVDTAKLSEILGVDVSKKAVLHARKLRKQMNAFNGVVDKDVDLNNVISRKEINEAIGFGDLSEYGGVVDMDTITEKEKSELSDDLNRSS